MSKVTECLGWERILKTRLRAFILPGIVPEDLDYICEVSWDRRVLLLVPTGKGLLGL